MKLKKNINNFKNGYHLNSKYWQNYKLSLPYLPDQLFEIAIGMILGDACMYKVSIEAYIKFEQGYKQKEFLNHLFEIFKMYCFMENPGTRLHLRGIMQNKPKSFWFKTFSHKSFTKLFTLFYHKTNKSTIFQQTKFVKKKISENLILNYLTPRGLAYWIMCDGSLQNDKKTIILHTQGFSLKENSILSNELNTKFKLNTKVILHKYKYYVIQTASNDAVCIYKLISPYVISSLKYKVPCIKNKI